MYRREVVGSAVYPYLTIQKNQGDHQICIAYGNLRWWIRKSLDTKTPYNRDTIEVIQASILVLQGITFDDQKITAGLGNTWCSNKFWTQNSKHVLNFTLWQNYTFYPLIRLNLIFEMMWILWKMIFWKCDFCEKCWFKNAIFVKNVTLKMRFSW